MYRILSASKDCYITNKIINNSFRATDANVGQAGTLDIFKLYDESKISGEDKPIELSRALIKFDLDPLRELTGSILDITSDSFKCNLKLFDVAGGQTLPSNFKIIVHPLSRSFDEGVGRDVTRFQDIDAANFVTASISGDSPNVWSIEGANREGLLNADDIDIIGSGNLDDGLGVSFLYSEQLFEDGTEDLNVDITRVISGTLAGLIPDYGLRIAFSGTQETDNKTRFVKRFASRDSLDTAIRPRLEIKFRDDIQDHHEAFFFNLSGSLFLNHFSRGIPSNLVSGSSLIGISGSDCMSVMIKTGSFEKELSASQHSYGASLFASGVYSASFAIDSFNTTVVTASNTIADFVRDSGSINFDVFWRSNDKTYTFHTGSVEVNKPETTGFENTPKRLIVSIQNARSAYKKGEKVRIRFVAFDDDEVVPSSKVPYVRKSLIFTQCYYRIRDEYSNTVIIPFDTTDKSTLLSTDSNGMYFDLYTNDFPVGRVFSIDVLVKDLGSDQVFKRVGGTFRIE